MGFSMSMRRRSFSAPDLLFNAVSAILNSELKQLQLCKSCLKMSWYLVW